MDEIKVRHINKPKHYAGKRRQFQDSTPIYPINDEKKNVKIKRAGLIKVASENKVSSNHLDPHEQDNVC
jgi:hypothetical protein